MSEEPPVRAVLNFPHFISSLITHSLTHSLHYYSLITPSPSPPLPHSPSPSPPLPHSLTRSLVMKALSSYVLCARFFCVSGHLLALLLLLACHRTNDAASASDGVSDSASEDRSLVSHSLTHSLTHSHTHTHTPSLPPSLPHSLTPSLTRGAQWTSGAAEQTPLLSLPHSAEGWRAGTATALCRSAAVHARAHSLACYCCTHSCKTNYTHTHTHTRTHARTDTHTHID
jgi:hypothetical protein